MQKTSCNVVAKTRPPQDTRALLLLLLLLLHDNQTSGSCTANDGAKLFIV
jgi:hypothetical protein